ncbi:MAG TPA: hypothetical protein VGS08_02470 [Candidatus Saccharimonadales bacterium]|nr:hypothetical protein [Candidatus Saccharimonadales bacterium]
MLAPILLVITVLFVLALGVKKALSLKVCVLCASILLTWTTLLVLYRTGHFHDTVLLSLLMGQCVTGLFYFLDRRVVPALRIFTLPFFLTLTTIFYVTITLTKNIVPPLLVLLGLWLVAYVIFAWRNDPGKKKVADTVMRCCEDK